MQIPSIDQDSKGSSEHSSCPVKRDLHPLVVERRSHSNNSNTGLVAVKRRSRPVDRDPHPQARVKEDGKGRPYFYEISPSVVVNSCSHDGGDVASRLIGFMV